MKKSAYFKLQLKRALRIYPSILTITIVTIAAIVISAFVLIQTSSDSEDKTKITIGLLGDLNESYLGIGIFALENIDNSRFYIDFEEMDDEEEAQDALKRREINGYVYLPEDFVRGIYYGENIPARYVMLNSPDGIGSILTGEITQIISDFVVETQNGVYSLRRLADEYNKRSNINSKAKQLNLIYIDFILERGNLYNLNILGIADLLSMGGYYICAVILFFLLLWGISCNKLLASKNTELSRMLNARGLRAFSQVMCEYGAFLCVTFITMLIFAVIFGAVTDENTFGIAELKTSDVSSCIMFVFKMLPVIVMITMMHMAFYEIVSSTVSGILLQFLIAIGLGYISGCFYPNYFFPDALQAFEKLLPSGAGFLYLRRLMSYTLSAKELVLPIIYTLIFAFLAVSARKKRMEGAKK